MKESYLDCSNEKIIVVDDNEGLLIYDSKDNIEEIFITENIIEELQTSRQKILMNKTLKENKKAKLDRKMLHQLIPICLKYGSLLLVTTQILLRLNIPVTFHIPTTVFEKISYLLGSGSMIILTFHSVYKNFRAIDKLNKELGRLNKELEQIDSLIEENQNKLIELKNNHSKTRKNQTLEFVSQKVQYKEKLKQLRIYLTLCYQIGVQEEEYLKFEHQGILEENLRKEGFDESEIEETKKLLKKTLRKREEQ